MMTETTQHQEAATANGRLHSSDNPDLSVTQRSSLYPSNDSASDNDASEKPVREKLKKTSIASIPKSGPNPSRNDFAIESDSRIEGRSSAEVSSNAQEPLKAEAERRGRPLRKRSFDDLEAEDDAAGDRSIAETSGHSRKRSRDVRTGEEIKGDERLRIPGQIPVQEEEEGEAGMLDRELSGSKAGDQEQITNDLSRSSDQDVADQEMRDSAFSPRKKRSRDQLDTETYREQKIPATEEAKAHRRSEENERDGTLLQNGNIDHLKVQPVQDQQEKSIGKKSTDLNGQSTTNVEDAASSSSLNVIDSAKPPSADQPPHISGDTANQQTQTSAAAFASSGFAALSGSTTSPFGTLGANTISTGASPFASVAASGVKGPGGSEMADKDPKVAANGTFGSAAASATSGFGAIGASSFGTAGTSNLRAFGGSALGSGFGGGFGGAPKLTSFATPTGDAKWGSGAIEVKPFGASNQDLEDEEASGSEDEAEETKAEENEEADGRFQQQGSKFTGISGSQCRITYYLIVETGEDGEETIFSSPRAALFRFDGSSWKEGGRGMFKFNVRGQISDVATEAQKSGRFIMRAHQTYRVLLNEPVFKEMLVGDAKGNEPKSRSFAFAVIEKGKAVPHMIRVSDMS